MENQGPRRRLPRRDRSPRLAGTRRPSNSSWGNSMGTKTSWKNSSVRTVRIQGFILCFIPFSWSKAWRSHVLFYLFLRQTRNNHLIYFISYFLCFEQMQYNQLKEGLNRKSRRLSIFISMCFSYQKQNKLTTTM